MALVNWMPEFKTGTGDPEVRVLSLGAGVQSSAVLLMMGAGQIKPADYAVFADTGNEPDEVYEWLEYLKVQSSIPIHVVSRGTKIQDDALATDDRRFASIPTFIRQKDGSVGMGRRQCTKDYKIYPVRDAIKELAGKRPKCAEIVFGISIDEVQRMREPHVKWYVHAYPLVGGKFSRASCVRWMEDAGYKKPPRSACIICPFHSDEEWRRMRSERPEEWEYATWFDEQMRENKFNHRFKGENFLHRSATPLNEVDLDATTDVDTIDMFGNECEGMCGV